MTWIKINDSFPDHPKIIGLSNEAFRTHIHGLCYCGRFLTDGFIPIAAINKLGTNETVIALVEAKLWIEDLNANGFVILNYLEHQTSKSQVEEKRKAVRERVKRYRNKLYNTKESDDWDLDEPSNSVTNLNVTAPEYRIQNTENRIQNTETSTYTDEETKEFADSEKSLEKGILDQQNLVPYFPPLPRVKSALESVQRLSTRLDEARKNGINAWNLSRLVEDEWDLLHNANDIGGCIALTVWYVSELQSRELSSSDIGRIGQMTKRFGRIALLAIDEAATKDLTDLVSYAYRVAQNMYKERQGK